LIFCFVRQLRHDAGLTTLNVVDVQVVHHVQDVNKIPKARRVSTIRSRHHYAAWRFVDDFAGVCGAFGYSAACWNLRSAWSDSMWRIAGSVVLILGCLFWMYFSSSIVAEKPFGTQLSLCPPTLYKMLSDACQHGSGRCHVFLES
jgi:hypothetical protein